jgi:HEAT repeat protein
VDRDAEAAERTQSLAAAISALREGDLSVTRLSRLSDLSREGVKALADAWTSIPEPIRVDLVRRCDELSEERVDLNFGRALHVALDDPAPVVRQLAIAGLWEDESDRLRDRLRRILQEDPSPDVRAESATALERFVSRAALSGAGDETALALRNELLAAASEAESAYAVRRRSLEALGPLGADEEVAEAIADAYNSGDHGLQCSAIYAMGRGNDPRWQATILAELENEDAELRFEAARAAGALGSSDALPLLLDAARDDDSEVRHAAINAIGQIGGRGAERALERLAEEAGEADLELIEAALEEVSTLLNPFQSPR